jgi:2-keto-4-pentenoate hydratase/2-oxohepta-3-ene-1,7-dioic acid hydratase in catechol pathway
MRVIRVKYRDLIFYAALEGEAVSALDRGVGLKDPIGLDQVAILPLVVPTKIVCVGLNYHAHAQELNKAIPEEPLLFLKPPSAMIGHGEAIVHPRQSQDVHYEGELALVMGKPCRNVSVSEAASYVFGFTCANDVTARDLQVKDGLYARAKGFDTFCPLGPWLETDFRSLEDQAIQTSVNGQVRQEGRTSDMIVSPFELISFISGIMTLNPGDVLLTGTPPGVGPMQPGDTVRVTIEGVGLLENPVQAAE